LLAGTAGLPVAVRLREENGQKWDAAREEPSPAKTRSTPLPRLTDDRRMVLFLPTDVAIGRSKRWGRAMREALQAYVKRVGELAEHVRGNEPATKPSPVGPLFTIPGSGRAAGRPIGSGQERNRHGFRVTVDVHSKGWRFERGPAADFGPGTLPGDEPIPVSVWRTTG
jgi:hypothetical protein